MPQGHNSLGDRQFPAAKLKQNLKLLSGWAHNILEI